MQICSSHKSVGVKAPVKDAKKSIGNVSQSRTFDTYDHDVSDMVADISGNGPMLTASPHTSPNT